MNKNKQQGFTLIELLIVVGIISVLGMAIYGIVKKVENSEKVNSTITFTTTVLQRINDASAVAPNYEKFGVSTSYSAGNSAFSNVTAQAPDALIKSGIIPPNNLQDNYVVSSYNQRVGFYYSTTPNLFFMSLPKLPAGACLQIGQQVQNYADALIVQSGGGGGVLAKTLDGNFDRDKLQTECLAANESTLVLVKSKE